MSSSDDERKHSEYLGAKRRKITRACDRCRKSKIKCDGNDMPNNVCTSCTLAEHKCTYVESAPKRGPPKGYVEGLERRVEKMSKLLRKFYPDGDYLAQLEEKPASPKQPTAESSSSTGKVDPSPTGIYMAITTNGNDANRTDTHLNEKDDDLAHIELSDAFQKMDIDGGGKRFYGKSSGAMLVRDALDVKIKFMEQSSGISLQESIPSTDLSQADPQPFEISRPMFWTRPQWETPFPGTRPMFIFPEPDLLESLVDLYFTHTNAYFPLLHRPTFSRQIAGNLHLSDGDFAITVLVVAAIGAQFSEDPRVYSEGETLPYSRGWFWFLQVDFTRTTALVPFSLHHLQYLALAVLFLQSSSVPHVSWTMAGVGLRLAQDVGAHRRKKSDYIPTMEDELWKRAFWVLVCMDRFTSSATGRPCSISNEDFDAEYPITLDDEELEEYLANPEKGLPPKQPSSMDFFVCMLDLLEIQSVALRTIYSINKSKILLGVFSHAEWEQHIVSELDSALNKWLDKIPLHLVWNPNHKLDSFFSQSTLLYSQYYHLQIFIHRPFIPTPERKATTTFPSLAICTNAARSCSNVVDIYRRRTNSVLETTTMAVFTSAIVLLLNIWGNKNPKHTHSRDMADITKCMRTLKICEAKWYPAGRICDILAQLASVGDIPFNFDPLQDSPPSGQHHTPPENKLPFTGPELNPTQFGFEMPANAMPANTMPWPQDYSFANPNPLPLSDDFPAHAHHAHSQYYNNTNNTESTAPLSYDPSLPHPPATMMMAAETPFSMEEWDAWGLYFSNISQMSSNATGIPEHMYNNT